MPLEEALPIAKQIAEGLEYAHERGIVHRDLKPANIKINLGGVVKIFDFGLAKALEGETAASDPSTSPTLSHLATQAGVILGTAAYMAPEQAKGKAVDRRADIRAFGCVLYEMLTGERAFGGGDTSETLAAVIRDAPDWNSLPPTVAPRIRDLLERCLAKDAKQRLQAMGDARIAIEEADGGGTARRGELVERIGEPAGKTVTIRYDAIIIGTGQAGPPLAGRLTASGMKVAIIERKLFGGTCVNTGCIPTKTMVASAYVARLAQRAAEYGVAIGGGVGVDMKQVKARKDAISGKSRAGVESWLKGMANCTVYEGHARLESAGEVSVGAARLHAERIFINVGGRAWVPPLPGLDQVSYLTNSSMMEIDFLPPHLLIIGGGYVGLEFGQMFRRFGSHVTIVEKGPRLVPHEDEDVSAAIAGILEGEGIELRLNAECIHFSRHGEEAVAGLSCEDGMQEARGSHVLLAMGRRPNTDDLGLEKAGVRTDERGYVIVDDQLRTNVPGIWALGDCNGRGAFTHTSYNDFEIVAANILDRDSRRVSDRILAFGLYIDPPLGRAGMTAAEALRSGRKAMVGMRPMTRVSRAVEKGESQGLMKIVVDADSKEILGAAILGPGGDEAIHSILDVMYAKSPYTVLQRAMHIHPTVSELIPTILGELKPLEAAAD